MLSVYCLTGCDTVSSFRGHGKRTAYHLMMQKAAMFQPLSNLGKGLTLENDVKAAAIKFVGAMYGKAECSSLNDLRCERAREKSITPKKLPPTEDSFELHVQRCIYQLIIWREAVIPMQDVFDPIDFGYEKTPDGLSVMPKLMNRSPAAPELLNDLVCNCKPKLCATRCKCLENEQPCTAACNCEGASDTDITDACANPLTHIALYDSDSDSESIVD